MSNPVGNVNLNSFFKNGFKSIEKLAAYVVGTLVATGNVTTGSTTKNDTLLAVVGAVIAALHLSTPKQAA